MDILKFIALLPLSIVRMAAALIALILGTASRILSPLLGTWLPPAWARKTALAAARLRTWADGHEYQASAAVFAAAAMLVALCAFSAWQASRPQPEPPQLLEFSVEAPTIRDVADENSTPSPISLSFSGSAAPIEQIGKDVTEGISISPTAAGVWHWQDDKTAVFTPETDWLPGQTYRIRFKPRVFLAPDTPVADNEISFTAPEMTAGLNHAYFYADPTDPALQRAVAEIDFTYPVAPAGLEHLVSLTLVEPGKKKSQPAFNITYDEHRLRATIQSAPLAMPEKDAYVEIEMGKGATSVFGGKPATSTIHARVNVPSLYSLQVNSLSTSIVNNAAYEPEQTLVLETSFPIQDKSVNANIKAWVLPDRPDGKTWHNADINEKILREQAVPLKLSPTPSAEEYAAIHAWRYQARPGATIYVRIDKDVKSFSGYKLPAPHGQFLEAPDFPPLLDFVSEGSLLALSGDHKLSIVTRNLNGVKLTVKRIMPGQIQHLVSQNRYGSYAEPLMPNGFGADNIAEVFETKIPIPNPDPVKPHYQGVDLSPYFGPYGKNLRGVFLICIQDYDPEEEALRDAQERQATGSENTTAQINPADYYGEHAWQNDDTPAESGGKYSAQRLIVVTDLGIIAKTNHDQSREVFVQSIHTGRPVAGAKVEVLGLNGEPIAAAHTDADGQASLPNLENFVREREPALFLVSKDGDSSFLPVKQAERELLYHRFDIYGESTPQPGALRAHLFSDRGIYRPGDTMHLGLIVRAFDWNKPLAGLPLELALYDPRGQEVLSRKISLPTDGFEEFSYTTSPAAATGYWSANLYLIKDNERQLKDYIGSVSVEVKEFLPDRLKVDAGFSAPPSKGWVKPENLNAQVNVQNLFGSPAQGRRIEGEISLIPSLPAFPGYTDYAFRSKHSDREGLSEQLPDQISNAAGNAVFTLDLAARINGTYRLDFLAKAYEQGSGRNVAARAGILVSPEEFLVGIKSDGDLGYVERGSNRSIELVAVDPDLRPVAANRLKLVLKEKKYLSVLTRDQYSGLYSYESKLRVDELDRRSLDIPTAGRSLPLPSDRPGNFILQIQNEQGEALNWVEYRVAGNANLTRSLERNAELQLALNKREFEPGEEIEIAINAPYPGNGLITIERDRVYAKTWFSSPTTASVQRIRIPEDFQGNGYVNVQFSRSPESTEIFSSPLSYGVLPFSTSLKARRAELEIVAPETVRPGQDLTMRVSSPKPAKMVVFAVDEGILQVADYSLQDPLHSLLPKRALEVKTAQILDLVLPMFRISAAASAPGGGADADLLARQLNPFARKTDAPVTYWSGLIEVDGETELVYPVPDYFNGKIRIMAVSVTDGQIGIFQTSSLVRDDFILTPNLPATVAPGDSFTVSLGVTNLLENGAGATNAQSSAEVPVADQTPLTIHLSAEDGLSVLGDSTAALSLTPGQEGFVSFQLQAGRKLGAARLVFQTEHQGKQFRREAAVSVRPAQPYRTDLQLGELGDQTVRLSNLRAMYPEFSQRDAAASYSPLVLVRGLSGYLIEYPHLCSEQLISGALPQLIQMRHPEFELLEKLPDHTGSAGGVDQVLPLLAARQNTEGGIGDWQGSLNPNPEVTAYAVHYLLELRDSGLVAPTPLLENATAYLLNYSDNPAYNRLDQLRVKAWTAYLTVRQEQIPTNLLAALERDLKRFYPEQMEGDISAAYLAATYKLLKQDEQADALMKRVLARFTAKNMEAAANQRDQADDDAALEPVAVRNSSNALAPAWVSHYDRLSSNATLLYLLERHFPELALEAAQPVLDQIIPTLSINRHTTFSAAMCLLALDQYARRPLLEQGEIRIAALAAPDGATGAPDSTNSGNEAGNGPTSAPDNMPTAGTQTPPDSTRTNLISQAHGLLFKAAFGPDTQALLLSKSLPRPAWYSLRQSGFDLAPAPEAVKNGLEVSKEYYTLSGEPVSEVKMGQEVVVFLRARSTNGRYINDVALVDLLPGGFELVPYDDQENLAISEKLTVPVPADSHIEEREDRVLIYCSAGPEVRTAYYVIRAVSAGEFTAPPLYGEAMYDRSVQASSPGDRHIKVTE